MRYLTFLLVTILLVGCYPTKRLCQKCPTKDSISYVETVTENPNYTIPDSVYYQLLFYCDSNYNVLLRDLENVNTGLNAEVVIKKVPYEDKGKINAILFTLRVSSDSILTLNRTIEKLKNEVKTVKVPYPVKEYKCRPFFVYCTIALFVIIALFIGWIYLKNKAKILSLLK